jgi:hypothetical protein
MSNQNSTAIRTMELQHNGLTLVINITNYWPARSMPFAQTPDCAGYDDEGEAGEVEFEVVSAEVDCQETFIEAFGLNDCEDLTTQVFQEMSK